MKRGPNIRRASSGMTLTEVLLAVFILGIVLVGLMQGLTTSAQVFHHSTFVRQAANVLALGDSEHPFSVNEDPVEDLLVSPDGSLMDGWTYERVCEEDEDEDGIYTVRTRVVQGRGGPGNEFEVVNLFYFPEGGLGKSNDGGLL